MSLAVSDILNDALVQETIKSLDGKGRSAPDAASLGEHPVLQLLEKNDALDSVTAAVIVADEMTRGSSNSKGLIAFLPPQVGAVATLMADLAHSDGVSSMAGLVHDGNPTALKIAVTVIAFSGTGREFEQAKSQMGRNGEEKMMREFIDLSIEILDALNDSQRWKAISPSLLKTFVEAVDNVSATETGRFRKQLLASSIETLKADVAAEGIDLKSAVIAAPAPEVPYATSLKLTEVLNDPLVQKTLAALGMDASEVDLTRNPAFAVLSRLDTLDSVSAAALIAVEGRHRNADLPKSVKAVVDVMGSDALAYGGPLALFGTDNATVHKLGIGMLADSLNSAEFSRMRNDLSGRRLKEEMGEIFEAGLVVIDRVIAAKSWQGMSPQLIDQFTQSMEAVKGVVENKAQKKLMTVALQELKTEVAKGTAAEVTGPQAGVSGPAATVKPAPRNSLKP